MDLPCPATMRSDRRGGSEEDTSRTPSLARGSETQAGANAPALRIVGGEGWEQAGFRTQRPGRAAVGAANIGFVAHLRDG